MNESKHPEPTQTRSNNQKISGNAQNGKRQE